MDCSTYDELEQYRQANIQANRQEIENLAISAKQEAEAKDWYAAGKDTGAAMKMIYPCMADLGGVACADWYFEKYPDVYTCQ